MNNLYFSRTQNTPEVILNRDKGIYSVQGVSMSENPRQFYKPIFEWFENNREIESIILNVKIDYFNTASVKMILDLFQIINKCKDSQINWICNSTDEDMIEVGNEFKEMLESNINIIFENS